MFSTDKRLIMATFMALSLAACAGQQAPSPASPGTPAASGRYAEIAARAEASSSAVRAFKVNFPQDYDEFLEVVFPHRDDAAAVEAATRRFFGEFLENNAPLAQNAPDDALRAWLDSAETFFAGVLRTVGQEACARIFRDEPGYSDIMRNRFTDEANDFVAAHITLLGATLRAPKSRPDITPRQATVFREALAATGGPDDGSDCANDIRLVQLLRDWEGEDGDVLRAFGAMATIQQAAKKALEG